MWSLIVLAGPTMIAVEQWIAHLTGLSGRIYKLGSPFWLDGAIFLTCLAPSLYIAFVHLVIPNLRRTDRVRRTQGPSIMIAAIGVFAVVIGLVSVLMVMSGGLVSCVMGDCL